MTLFLFPLSLVAAAVSLTKATYLPRANTYPAITWGNCDSLVVQGTALPVHCANLSVPLDYTDPNSNATLTLELVKVTALEQPSKGTIITNFGGPGAEGIYNLALYGSYYQK